jgi:hypothetical protein
MEMTGFDPKYYLARNVPVQSESLSKALQTFLAGFANHSHFTEAFRRVTGTTDGFWLRDVGQKCGQLRSLS